jgi:hypothetical protein
MDRRFRATFSRAVLQWLLEASAEAPIITSMVINSSSAAYGSSFHFHDNGNGNDDKKNFFTPGKRKSNRDDDSQGPLDCAMFLLKAPLGYQGSRSWATFKKCAPPAVLSRQSASSGGPGCSQGKKRVFKTGSNLRTIASSFCSNNLRFCSYG